MSLKQALTLSAALLASSTALAGGPNDMQSIPKSSSNGFYIEPYVGYGHIASMNNSFRRNGLSGGFAFGYKATENWAVDGGYTQMPHSNVSTYYIYMSLKYIYSVNKNWDIFAKLGPAYVSGSRNPALASSDDITLFFGYGVTYWISQNLGFVVQNSITTRNGNVPMTYNFTGGLDYFF